MGETTFLSQLRAGSIRDTTGTTLGQDVKNIGLVCLVQTEAITQATNGSTAGLYTTNIVLPAGSQIIRIEIFKSVAWSGAAQTVNVGTSPTATELGVAADNDLSTTLGFKNIIPGDDATRTNKWVDVGTSDVRLYVLSTNTGTGAGYLSVHYVPEYNLI